MALLNITFSGKAAERARKRAAREKVAGLMGQAQAPYQMGEEELFPGEIQEEAISSGLPIGTPAGQAPPGLMTKGTGYLGSLSDPREIAQAKLYGGLMGTEDYEGIGAAGLRGIDSQQTGMTPSAVREYEFWKKLPDKQKEDYLTVKRTQKFLDVGGGFVAPSQVDPTSTRDVALKGLKPSEQVDYLVKKKEDQLKAAAQTKAKLSLSKSQIQYDKSKELISGVLDHKGLEESFGLSSYAPVIRGTERAGFESKLNQLKNTVFITNREALKGGGSITDYEGDKAEESELRASSAQSAEEFREAMKDYEYWVDRGFSQLKRASEGDFSVKKEKRRKTKAPQGALDYLKANPNFKAEFKAKYGYTP